MAPPSTRTLLPALFDRADHPLALWYAGPLDRSAALRAFAWANQTKIRKKVRRATDDASRRDLRCELAVAALLADRHHPLAYEPLAAEQQRGPDFLLTHKGHTPVYVEVTRIRPRAAAARGQSERLAAVLCGKLGQLASGGANLLVLVHDDGPIAPADLDAAIVALRQRAAAQDETFFTERGLAGARAFRRQIAHLGGILAVAPSEGAQSLVALPAPRRPLPPDFVRALAAWDLAAQVGSLSEEGAG